MDLHSLPPFVLVMVLISVVNIVIGHVRTSKATARETRRIVIGLTAELTELLRTVEGKIGCLEGGRRVVLSSHSSMAVYRASLPRIHAMPEALIGPLIHAYTLSEQTEYLVAAHSKARTAMAYEVLDSAPIGELTAELEGAAAAIRDAIVHARDTLPTLRATLGRPIVQPDSPEAPSDLAERRPA